MNNIRLINLPQVTDPRGNLTFIEGINHIPFEIKRVFWIYDVPGGETRGGHAYKTTHEFIIALSGSFDVKLDTGNMQKIYSLNRSYYGLYVPAGTWRQMENFSTNSLALVLASNFFNSDDYIRDYNEFKNFDFSNIITKSDFEIKNKTNYIKKSNINDCELISFDINHRIKGNITVVENNKNIPFGIERVYYLYDIPGGEERGGHAHKKLYQYIVAASGSFDIVLNDGVNEKVFHLNRSYNCLKIVPGIWRELKNFSSGSICLVLASEKYDENDYIRSFDDFVKYKKNDS